MRKFFCRRDAGIAGAPFSPFWKKNINNKNYVFQGRYFTSNKYLCDRYSSFFSVLLCTNQTNQKTVMNSLTINHEPPITKMLFKMNWNLLGSNLLPLFHHSAFNKICCDKILKFKFKLQYASTTSNTVTPKQNYLQVHVQIDPVPRVRSFHGV